MVDGREFFLQHSGLTPMGFRALGEGMCNCQPAKRIQVYRKQGAPQCAACCSLRQNYKVKGKEISLRMGLGCYLFISEKRLRFWGNQDMTVYNPRFECNPASGAMSAVMKELVLTPPEPPWMFISFAASISADSLAITTDQSVLRFSGDTIINRNLIPELNRAQLMQMVEAGLTRKEWDEYLGAYYRGWPADIEILRTIEKQRPLLQDIRFLPPKESAEHIALRWLFPQKKPTRKATEDEG